MWTLAIDFGTSNTAGAMFVDGNVVSLELGGERRMPSVALLDEAGNLIVGQEAVNQAVLHPDRVERAPKRRLGKGSTLLLGGQAVPIATAVAAFMKPYLDEGLRRRNGAPPAQVVLTHPARWSDERLTALRNAAAVAGISNPVFCPEPVAAAVHYADDKLVDGHYVAVYDLGGGTFDTAVLRRVGAGFEVVGLPGGDERIGGEDFDHRLYRYFGERLAREDPELWEKLNTSDDRRYKRANADLLAQTRQAKEALSRNPTARVFVQIADRDLMVTREEFESLISDDVDRTVDEMARTIQIAGLVPEHIARLYLAGGASRIPLVLQRMAERFGERVVTWDDPKCVVTMGAAKLLAHQVSHAPGATGVNTAKAPAPAPANPAGPAGWNQPPQQRPAPQVAPPQPRPAPPAPRPAQPAARPQPAPSPAPGWSGASPSPPRPAPHHAPGRPPAPPAHRPSPAPPGPGWAPSGPPPGAPPTGRPPGRDKTNLAWIMCALGLCTCVTPLVGIYLANEAKKEGDPMAVAALWVNIVVTGLFVLFTGLYVVALFASV
jgi:actin-like ATPase involved in cell morphogenesis